MSDFPNSAFISVSLIGDMVGNSATNIVDALIIDQNRAGLAVLKQKDLSDTNLDGKITIIDAENKFTFFAIKNIYLYVGFRYYFTHIGTSNEFCPLHRKY